MKVYLFRITPKKETTFATNAAATRAVAIRTPANAGPTARARLNSIPLSAEAASRSSFATNSGRTARHVGVSKASPAESANVSASRHQTSNGQDCQRDCDADHPAFGEENQLAAVHDGSRRNRPKRQVQRTAGRNP